MSNAPRTALDVIKPLLPVIAEDGVVFSKVGGYLDARYLSPSDDADQVAAALKIIMTMHEAMVAALEEIRDRHIPDQPMTSPIDDLAWAQKQYGELRRIAAAALAFAREAIP